MFVFILYIVSAVAWGLVLFELIKTIAGNIRHGLEHPPLLIPFSIASLSVFVESVYFGATAFGQFFGYNQIVDFTTQENYWFIPKLFMAISGVLLFISLKAEK